MSAELPWERAHESDARYAAWCAWLRDAPAGAGPAPPAPWSRVPRGALALLRAALRPEPAARADMDALQRAAWPPPDEPRTRPHPRHHPAGRYTRMYVCMNTHEARRSRRGAALVSGTR